MREAPYPVDTRAKGWRFELDHERIRQSDTWALAAPEHRPWLLMLWMVAWEQTPCGSLPDDDALIAARIGMAPKAYAKARATLRRGWALADDGRLYHSVITERVAEMVAYREKEASRRAAYRERMQAGHGTPPVVPPTVTRDSDGTDATGTGTGTGTKKRKRSTSSSAAWTPPGWVPAQPWADFEAMRRAMHRVPFTDAARQGVARELEKLRDQGHDPTALLQTAVTNGWRTVYPPKVTPLRRDEEATRAANAAANEGAKRLLFGDKTHA